jgi:hypothetical protein
MAQVNFPNYPKSPADIRSSEGACRADGGGFLAAKPEQAKAEFYSPGCVR